MKTQDVASASESFIKPFPFFEIDRTGFVEMLLQPIVCNRAHIFS